MYMYVFQTAQFVMQALGMLPFPGVIVVFQPEPHSPLSADE